MRIIYLLIIIFLIVVLQVSLMPNLQIAGSMINLPLVFLAFVFHFANEKPESLKHQMLLILILGIFLDLLSNGIFLSATLSLLLVVFLARGFEKLVSFRDHLGLVLPVLFFQVMIYNLIYYVLNRELNFQWFLIKASIIDALLTAIFFFMAYLIVEWLKKHFKRQDIKLMAR